MFASGNPETFRAEASSGGINAAETHRVPDSGESVVFDLAESNQCLNGAFLSGSERGVLYPSENLLRTAVLEFAVEHEPSVTVPQ